MFSLPPWGWWPLAFVGIAVIDRLIAGAGWRARAGTGFAAGLVLYIVTLFWMRDFTIPGYVIASLVEAGILAAALAATPPGRWRHLGLPAAVTLAEALRWVWPFGGVPLSGLALGQVSGPLAPPVRIGGALLAVALTGAIGSAIALAAERRWRVSAAVGAGVVIVALAGLVAPDGSRTGSLAVAAVQGGGPLGTRALDTAERIVFERHLDASAEIDPPVDLVLWPEDVVDVEGDVTETREGVDLAALARRLDATLVTGVVEGDGDRFHNSAVAWSPAGEVVDRYEKVHRVPFGEYVPFRSLIDRVADLSDVARDAVAGSGPAVLDTPAATVGVLISYELFFADRAGSAIDEDARLLLGPTNASSYRTTLVAAQEVAASQLRAIETGRWMVQAAPTGFSAVIDHRGKVLQRTGQRERAVIQTDVQLRRGRTIAGRLGRLPVAILAGLVLVVSWLLERREGRVTPPAAP